MADILEHVVSWAVSKAPLSRKLIRDASGSVTTGKPAWAWVSLFGPYWPTPFFGHISSLDELGSGRYPSASRIDRAASASGVPRFKHKQLGERHLDRAQLPRTS